MFKTAAFMAICAAALAVCGSVNAQTSSNPYHVDNNWNKIQGRTIGVASGFKMDPDGKHLWIIDRCGANG